MPGDSYKIQDQQGCYFLTLTVVQWIDLFSRREWLLDKFAFEARRTGRAKNYKIWKDDNHAISLKDIDAMGKVDYIHENPVEAGFVYEPQQYVYSSSGDYAGIRGLVKVSVI